jgi:hypothetical protein
MKRTPYPREVTAIEPALLKEIVNTTPHLLHPVPLVVGGDKDLASTCILSSLSLGFVGEDALEGGDNVAMGGSAG